MIIFKNQKQFFLRNEEKQKKKFVEFAKTIHFCKSYFWFLTLKKKKKKWSKSKRNLIFQFKCL